LLGQDPLLVRHLLLQHPAVVVLPAVAQALIVEHQLPT